MVKNSCTWEQWRSYTRAYQGVGPGQMPKRLRPGFITAHRICAIFFLHSVSGVLDLTYFRLSGVTHAYMNDRQSRAAQSKLNVTSRKTGHYCIPAAQLYVREVTRPSFSRRLKGVACEIRWRTGSKRGGGGAHDL